MIPDVLMGDFAAPGDKALLGVVPVLGVIFTGVVDIEVVVVGEKADVDGCFAGALVMVIGLVGVVGVEVGSGADAAVGVEVAEEAAAKRSNLFLRMSSADKEDSGVVDKFVGEVSVVEVASG